MAKDYLQRQIQKKPGIKTSGNLSAIPAFSLATDAANWKKFLTFRFEK